MEIIHIVLGKANPERMNGVNKVVFQLATQQSLAGQKVSVWGITKDTRINFDKRYFSTMLFQAQNNPFSLDKTLIEALKAKQKNTIFHIHGGWIPTFFSIAKVLQKYRIPYVFTPHGAYNTIAMQRSFWQKKVYFILFERFLLKNAMKIHCIGQSEVVGLNEIFKNTKSILQPYGYEFSENNLGNNLANPSQFIIGFIGRLDIYTKGLDLLIEAFSHFQKDKNNVALWIIGDSEEKQILAEKIENLGINKEKTTLWGSKFGQEKDDLLSKLTIFAHPSRNEGLPTAVLEAMAQKKPCIITQATNLGAKVEEYQCGIVIENNNMSALHNAMEQLFDLWQNNELYTMQFNARKMVKDEFNWKKITQDFQLLYA